MSNPREDRLRELIPLMKEQTAGVGCMHPLWDGIFTAEALLNDGNPWPFKTKEEALTEVLKWFESVLACRKNPRP